MASWLWQYIIQRRVGGPQMTEELLGHHDSHSRQCRKEIRENDRLIMQTKLLKLETPPIP